MVTRNLHNYTEAEALNAKLSQAQSIYAHNESVHLVDINRVAIAITSLQSNTSITITGNNYYDVNGTSLDPLILTLQPPLTIYGKFTGTIAVTGTALITLA